MSGFTKLPAVKYVDQPCNCCPRRPVTMPTTGSIHPGFGSVDVTRGDELALSDVHGTTTVEDYEALAKLDPEHDWRVTVNGPMYGVVYQRQGEGEWIAVENLDGFA